jgi:hypothetical protein
MRTKLFLVTAALAAALPAQSWTQQSLLLVQPTQRRLGAAAFEAAGSRLIFLGGVSQTPAVIQPETWRFNGTWQLLAPPAPTVGRWGHQLVTNTLNGRLIAFGGRAPTISGFANDTIEWDGTQWNAVPTPASPSPRYLYGMSFDSRRGVAVLFGGRTATTTLGETWEFNGVSWSQRTLANTPAPRSEMAMVFDSTLGKTVLFGGYDLDTDTIYGDTWFFDGQDWLLVPTPGVAPTARYRPAAVYDSTRKRTVLYGGFDGTNVVRDTFEFNGDTWATIATGANVPQAATETLHAYDPVRKKFVLFGGFGTTFSNQTWEYGYPATVNPGTFVQFGTACDTGPLPLEVTSSVPTLGQTWQLDYANLPTALNTVLLVALGLSNQSWTGIPLPFDLAPLGLAGCNLFVSADVINAVLPAAGTGLAQHTLAIPNTASLENAVVYTQGIVLEIGGPGLGFVGTTKGGYAVIGKP